MKFQSNISRTVIEYQIILKKAKEKHKKISKRKD